MVVVHVSKQLNAVEKLIQVIALVLVIYNAVSLVHHHPLAHIHVPKNLPPHGHLVKMV